MEYTPSQIRTWSMLGSRGTFGVCLAELAYSDDRIIALTADLCTTSGLDRFREQHAQRFFNAGIAEQNMVGIAAGFAARGFVPFATTFANFAALRACEQVRHFLGYMNENVKLVGMGSGFSMGFFGVTHYGIEDIAALRAFTNLIILSPADGLETVKCVQAAALHSGPVYLRLGGVMNMPIIYREDYAFKLGKAVPLRSGRDVLLIATGTMVHPTLKAAEALSLLGIEAEVLNMHTIKPLDTATLSRYTAYPLVVTIEEHSVQGGLGGAVAEYYSTQVQRPRQWMIGIPQDYPKAGDYHYMLETLNLTGQGIADIVVSQL